MVGLGGGLAGRTVELEESIFATISRDVVTSL